MGINRKRILEVRIMSKMLKAIAMLLVIAAVVFAAGCANKAPATENNTTPAAPAQTTNASAVTPAETNASAVTPAETPVVVINTTETNNTGNITENNTSVVSPAAPTGTHVSNAQRKLDLAKNRTQNSSV